MKKVNLKRISEEQLEKERNPNYKYFDIKQETAVEWIIRQLRELSHSLEAHLGMGDIRITQGMIDDFEEQAKKMEKEQVELRYKDGSPMRKYNSPKLQAIEMENNKSVTAIEWLVEMLIDNKYLIKDATHLFEQAKQKRRS